MLGEIGGVTERARPISLKWYKLSGRKPELRYKELILQHWLHAMQRGLNSRNKLKGERNVLPFEIQILCHSNHMACNNRRGDEWNVEAVVTVVVASVSSSGASIMTKVGGELLAPH